MARERERDSKRKRERERKKRERDLKKEHDMKYALRRKCKKKYAVNNLYQKVKHDDNDAENHASINIQVTGTRRQQTNPMRPCRPTTPPSRHPSCGKPWSARQGFRY